MSANGRRKQSFLKSCKILDEWYFYILYLQLSALADKIYSNTSKALIYTLSVYKAWIYLYKTKNVLLTQEIAMHVPQSLYVSTVMLDKAVRSNGQRSFQSFSTCSAKRQKICLFKNKMAA